MAHTINYNNFPPPPPAEPIVFVRNGFVFTGNYDTFGNYQVNYKRTPRQQHEGGSWLGYGYGNGYMHPLARVLWMVKSIFRDDSGRR